VDPSIDEDAALIIVDVQKDFCAGGALPVSYGEQVVPILNEYVRLFRTAGAHVYATRDWHPPDHTSFIANGGPWPPHCIQHTEGAEYHEGLHLPRDTAIISKAGTEREAHSGFDGTELDENLKRQGIRTVFVGGLATEYCVKQTVLDALGRGFETFLLEDAIRGISQDDSARAIEEMLARGAQRVTLTSIASSTC
jgi:nicotinamidase/pyrazinamidase